MPRPNARWQAKYDRMRTAYGGNPATRLSGVDDVLSAAKKLSGSDAMAEGVILQALRPLSPIECVRVLLDMDSIQLHGNKIVRAYRDWAGNDYSKLVKAVSERDESLLRFIRTIT
jgi:hypothetical protein